MTDHILVGGGALAREIHDWFSPSLALAGHRFVGYIDDTDQPMRGTGHELPQLGPITGYLANAGPLLVLAIADPRAKAVITLNLLGRGAVFATLLHPTAWISASAKIGQGSVVSVFTDVSANAVLGEFSLLNGYASVGHDGELGDCSTVSGYVDLTGAVRVGRECFFGSGARVLPKLSIGERCVIGAGAVVVRSVPAGVTLYAAPARRL